MSLIQINRLISRSDVMLVCELRQVFALGLILITMQVFVTDYTLIEDMELGALIEA